MKKEAGEVVETSGDGDVVKPQESIEKRVIAPEPKIDPKKGPKMFLNLKILRLSKLCGVMPP